MATRSVNENFRGEASYVELLQVVGEQQARIAKLEARRERSVIGVGRLAAILVAVAVAVAVAAPALASIPSPGGVIHACYRTGGTHTLQVIDASSASCPSGTKAIKWNEKGRRGPQGLQGPPGPSGSVPTKGYSTWDHGKGGLTSNYVSVVSIPNLPAGAYIVTATTTAVPDGDDEIDCAAGTDQGLATHYIAATNGYGTDVPMAVTGRFIISNNGAAEMWCKSVQNDTSSAVGETSITATLVS